MRLLALALVAAAAAPAAPYEATVLPVTRGQLGASWRPGCPVPPSGLRRVRVTYWGFDGIARRGEVVVAARAAAGAGRVFGRLYAARFPIRRMRPVAAYGANDERSMRADNTSAFNCRYAIAPGPRRWSAHAYGQAIDVNPLENPYVEGGRIHPATGKAFLDRSRVRRGMILRGGSVVRAFAAEGWVWGGRWAASPDYQHFSLSGG